MKSFVAFLALVAVAAAAEIPYARSADVAAEILRSDAEVRPDGYNFDFETSNGIKAQESGVLKNVGREDEGIAVQGENSYRNDEGDVISLIYTADENGYRPQGSHLPVSPPIPDAILRALDFISKNPPRVEASATAGISRRN